MAKLDKRRVKFVKSLPIDVRVDVLYEYLRKGTSNRDIEKRIVALKEEDGWQSWSVIHFYGFNRFSKKSYPYITKNNIKDRLMGLNDADLEEFHLNSDKPLKEKQLNIIMTENDGKDIFRSIKTRQGQHKLRELLLQNYESRCALCNVSHPRLLITSHVKAWSNSRSGEERRERVDPCNAILLCAIHDALFDNGFISFDDNYRILFSTKFNFEDQGISKEIKFRKPNRNLPSPKYLKYHREKYGYK